MQELTVYLNTSLSQDLFGRKWLTAVCRMPVDFPSDSCSFRNKYSPCTGRKCCGFTIL